MTLNPFHDYVEVLLLPHTSDGMDAVFSPECFSRQCADKSACATLGAACADGSICKANGYEYRGHKTTSRSGIQCVEWDDHTRYPHTGRNNPTTNPYMGLEDGPFCRNPDVRARPWCYLAEQTAAGKWFEVCDVGVPVDRCSKDLPVVAIFTANKTWPISVGSDRECAAAPQ